MANPFYPPKRQQTGEPSRGAWANNEQSRDVAFDPDRRGIATHRLNKPYDTEDYDEDDVDQYVRRQPTDGPGGAATFYPSQHAYEQGVGEGENALSAPDYRAQYNHNTTQSYAQSGARNYHHTHSTPYDYSPQHSNIHLVGAEQQHEELRRDHGGDYTQQQRQDGTNYITTNVYPPSNLQYQQDSHRFNSSTASLQLPSGIASRPDTPGIYMDRAPKTEKLSPEQRKIAETFPKDLDEEGGSLLKTAGKMMKDWRTFIKWKYTHYYLLLILICALVALMTIYHKQIVEWLTPVSKKIRDVSWGWVIPVAILFVISFPPLFGHEIVGVLCGVVYGLWMGFGILSLGTLLGELGNFYAFKYFLQKHGERFERKSIDYACMAHIVREGGFMVILMARLSAIPGHFTTAVFATVGMNVFVFTIAAILSLPKQLVVVYLGVAIEQSGAGNESTRSKVIKYVVLIVSFLVTVGVAVFLYDKMQKARPTVQARLRERRFQMLTEAGNTPTGEEHNESEYFGNGDDSGKEAIDEEIPASKKSPRWFKWLRKGKGKQTTDMNANSGAPLSVPMQEVSRYSFDSFSAHDHKVKNARYAPYSDLTADSRTLTNAQQWHGSPYAVSNDHIAAPASVPVIRYNDTTSKRASFDARETAAAAAEPGAAYLHVPTTAPAAFAPRMVAGPTAGTVTALSYEPSNSSLHHQFVSNAGSIHNAGQGQDNSAYHGGDQLGEQLQEASHNRQLSTASSTAGYAVAM